ncbi:MAG: protease HtpX [Myxococcaceae bacterium]|nr:protease HtpX [Myxococcaceae bacterium]MCI0671400.1 protease HtpX [Myxococcaceae bacterium]
MGTFAKRILLFVATNLAVLLVLAVVMRLLGVDRMLAREGAGMNLGVLLVYAAVIGFTGSLISLATSKWMAKRFTGAHVITTPRDEREAWLLTTVQQLARRTGIGMPEVAIYASPEPNAFATGARRNKALVAVSTGLLQRMGPDEAEAVLGHEVAHVANGDMVTLTLLQGVVNTFVIFLSRVVGDIVDRTVFRSERGHGPGFWVTSLVAQMVLGIFATLIVLAYSRRRELRADHGSARLLGPAPMIAALERLRGARDVPVALPDSLRAFGIRGGPGAGFGRLFRSHPPLEERIARLEELAGRA